MSSSGSSSPTDSQQSSVERAVAVGREAVGLGRDVVERVRSEQVTFLAAAIAYYAFVSVLPALLLLLAVAATVGGSDLAAAVGEASGDALSPVGRDLLANALLSAAGRAQATAISLPLLAWSALRVFRGLSIAFGRIYGIEESASFAQQVRDAAITLGAVGLAIAGLVAVSVLVGVSDVAFAGVVGSVALLVFLSVAFFPLYYLLPDVDLRPRAAVPGTVLAAGGWTLLGTVFRVYAETADQFAIYGVFGAVLLLVTWFYVGSLILLAGATLNAVLAAGETGTHLRPPADTSDT